jgi:hypothetical protein
MVLPYTSVTLSEDLVAIQIFHAFLFTTIKVNPSHSHHVLKEYWGMILWLHAELEQGIYKVTIH